MMKSAIAAALAAALAQTAPSILLNPADTDRNGVVTEDEKADYLAKKAAGVRDQPPTIGVAAPKTSGDTTIILGGPGSRPNEATAAGDPPANASEFEKSIEAGIRKDARDD